MYRESGFAALVVLAVAAGCVGTAADAAITELQPRVSASDTEMPETGDDGVRTCTWVGPPPGNYGLTGHVSVERSVGSGGAATARFRVEVRVADAPWRTARNVSLTDGGYERVTLFHTAANEGTVTAGEEVTVGVRVLHHGRAVAEVNRTVAVEESGRCVDDSDE